MAKVRAQSVPAEDGFESTQFFDNGLNMMTP